MLERAMLLPFTRIAANPRLTANLQRAEALVQSESTRDTAVHLQQSLSHLAAIEELLQLRVRWSSEQERRQQQRLARQRTRLQWQQALLERLGYEREG
jgi:hypothetical protein